MKRHRVSVRGYEWRLWPNTLSGHISLILVASLGLSHFISLGLYFDDRGRVLELLERGQLVERVATTARLIMDSPQSDHAQIIRLANSGTFRVDADTNSGVSSNDDVLADSFLDALSERLDGVSRDSLRIQTDRYSVSLWDHLAGQSLGSHDSIKDHLIHLMEQLRSGDVFRVSLKIREGYWLNFKAPDHLTVTPWSIRFVLSLIVMLIAIVMISIWAARYMTAPLMRLADAADRLGRDVDTQPLVESGPAEIRRAARKFNEMQARLRSFINDRTEMIAAISHDLRTPLMRMRLRAELLEEGVQQDKFAHDIEEMESIISSTLTFASAQSAIEHRTPVDLVSLVRGVVDDLRDAGQSIVFEESQPATVLGDPNALRRAISNLIENGSRYATQVVVSVAMSEGKAVVCIEDDGPGIPEDLLDEVFKPFRRVDNSRNRQTGGVGLGLPIARTVFRVHGGDVSLSNRPKGGLCAEANLPIWASATPFASSGQ